MNSTAHLKRLALSEKFRKALSDATTERERRRAHVRTVLGDEPGWVVYERGVMEELVNKELAAKGVGPVDHNEILSIEAQAAGAGQADFVKRFATNAADLVIAKIG